jgi:hypothetical protein
MDRHTHRQLQGAAQLITDTVGATVQALGETHLAAARHPYAVLARVPGVNIPAQVVARIQFAITGGVYRAVGVANQLAGAAIQSGLQRLVTPDKAEG